MSEQEQAPVQEDRPRLMNPLTRNLIVGTAVVVILLTLTAWAGTIRTEGAKRSGLLSDTAALAASFKYPILEANSMRTTAGQERLEPMLEEIRAAGKYVSLTLTDADGNVIASTHEKAAPVKDMNDEPWVGRTEAGLKATAPVETGGVAIGYLIVETDR